MSNRVTGRDGVQGDAGALGVEALFRADVSDADRAAFNAATPNRVAYRHAHSQQNPEKDWGRHTLDAVRFAFYVLNERYGQVDGKGVRRATLGAKNTVVIASSVSNGGGAALAAAEADTEGLIDGVAVTNGVVTIGSITQNAASHVNGTPTFVRFKSSGGMIRWDIDIGSGAGNLPFTGTISTGVNITFTSVTFTMPNA